MAATIYPGFEADEPTTIGRSMVTAADAAAIQTLIGVYSEAEVDALISGLTALEAEDIDTLAEINAILTDANLASIAYVDGLASNYATAAQGAKADTALQPADITSGAITAGTGDIDFDNLGGGAELPLTLTASAATETPLAVQGAASQTANLQEWQNSSGATVAVVSATGSLSCSPSDTTTNSAAVFANTTHTAVRALWGASGQTRNLIHAPLNASATFDNGLAQKTNDRRTIVFARAASAGTPKVSISASTTGLEFVGEFDNDNVAGNTRFLLWDVDSNALVRVSVGAADSGGTGFKVLRIPN